MGVPAIRPGRAFGCGFGLFDFAAVFIACRVWFGIWRNSGVMVFLALDELLPAAKRYSDGHETVYGLTTGMAVIAVSLVLFHF